jgi:predicted nucleic-acid-binding Zn-ribbon protein
MAFSKCPSCGGSRLYRSAQHTNANGGIGANLLPNLSPGLFRVVVCKDCGLTNLFASALDLEVLRPPEWEPMDDGISARTHGLGHT